MIAVWIEDTSELSAPGPQDFVEALEALGLSLTQSLPTTDAVGLLFAPLSHPIIEGLPTSKRARTILVSNEVESSHADSTRRRLGFLGLVEESEWSRWRGGMLVVDGLYGREDVASAAGLVLTPRGLRATDTAPLPTLVGRFLESATRTVGVGDLSDR